MNDDSEPKTPAQTPSAMQRIGLVVCPKCKGTRLLCDLCNEGGRVAVDVGIKWGLAHGSTIPPADAPTTDPAPDLSELDDKKE